MSLKKISNRDNLIRIFEDTENWCRENEKLAEAVARSIAGAKLYTGRSCRNYDVFRRLLTRA